MFCFEGLKHIILLLNGSRLSTKNHSRITTKNIVKDMKNFLRRTLKQVFSNDAYQMSIIFIHAASLNSMDGFFSGWLPIIIKQLIKCSV